MYTLSSVNRNESNPFQRQLRVAFTYSEARAAGLSAERLYAWRDQGVLHQVARGLYRWADAEKIDQDLLEIAHRAPRGTLCLVTALARHGLVDTVPPQVDIAIPRGSRIPVLRKTVSAHVFARDTFDVGRKSSSSARTCRSVSTRRSEHSSMSFACAIAKGPMSPGKHCAAGLRARALSRPRCCRCPNSSTGQRRRFATHCKLFYEAREPRLGANPRALCSS